MTLSKITLRLFEPEKDDIKKNVIENYVSEQNDTTQNDMKQSITLQIDKQQNVNLQNVIKRSKYLAEWH